MSQHTEWEKTGTKEYIIVCSYMKFKKRQKLRDDDMSQIGGSLWEWSDRNKHEGKIQGAENVYTSCGWRLTNVHRWKQASSCALKISTFAYFTGCQASIS